jgi:hypothetical protein
MSMRSSISSIAVMVKQSRRFWYFRPATMMKFGRCPSDQSGSPCSMTRLKEAGTDTRPLASTFWWYVLLNLRATARPFFIAPGHWVANENGGSSCCHCPIRRLSHLWVPGWRSLLGGGGGCCSRARRIYIIPRLAGACMKLCLGGVLPPRAARSSCYTGMPWNFMVIKGKDGTPEHSERRNLTIAYYRIQ